MASTASPITPSSLGRLVTGGLGSSISMLNNNQEQHFYHQASDWFDAPAEGETEMAPPLSTLPHQEKGAAATQDTKPKADLSGLPIEELARRLGEKISANDSNQLMPAVPPPNYVVKDGVRLTSTGKPSHARKVSGTHIKRPRNAFILFRSHACMSNLVPRELGITDHRHISRIVGTLWKNLPPETKKVWEGLAEKEKEEHRKQNPNYKYKPQARGEASKRRRKREQTEEEVEDEERKCEVVARALIEGGEVDEDKLAQQVEEQKEKDAAQGKQRAVKYRQKRAKVSRDAQMRNSMSVEPEEPEPSREFSAEDYLQPEAFDFGASGGSMPPETHNMFQRYSEPLGNDIDLMLSQGGLPTPRFNPPSSGLYHSSWQHPSGIGAYYNSTSSYTPSRSSPSSYRQPLGGSDQDLLHRIQHGQEMGRDWPPKNTRSASTPLYSSTRWTDEGRQWGGRNEFDAFGLGHLLNDEHAPQSFSALGQAVRANDHRDRSYTLEPEQKVQYVYLTPQQAADSQLVDSIRQSGFGITFDAEMPARTPVDIVL